MIRLTGMNSGLDTDAMVKELVSAYTKKGEKNVKEKTKFEWKNDIWKDVNKKIKSFYSKVRNMQMTTSYNQKKTVASDEKKVSVVAGDKAVRGTQTLKVESLAKTGYVTGKQLNVLGADGKPTAVKATADTKLSDLGITSADGELTITRNGVTNKIDANKDTTIGGLVDALAATGVSASFDEATGRLFISAKDSGTDNDFTFGGAAAINALGLTNETGGSVIKGSDATIVLNGATFTSNTNAFNINGMAINVKAVTEKGYNEDGTRNEDKDEVITLTTDTDTDAIYNNIKGLINDYSKLINELDKLYNADRAKGYEPLTDEEKDALSDTEVEKWETKIKESLLRRDGNLSSVINAMKNASVSAYRIGETETSEGKLMSLSDFGIATLGYFASEDNQKNALHINGDADDENVSGETNKLKQMIAGNPEEVAEFFAKYMTNLANQFNTLSRSTTNRSYGNFYDDKKVKTDMASYEKKVADWEDYVKDIEDRYYKQFSKMESSLAKLNSTQTSLSNYFG